MIKKLLREKKKALVVLFVVVLAVIVFLFLFFRGNGEVSIEVASYLKSVAEVENISTTEYTYNSVATVMEKSKVKYYVQYNGTVKAGFDFEDVEVAYEDDEVIIILPEIKVFYRYVDTNLDYIFTKDKYNAETVYQEAYKACEKDLKEETELNTDILDRAESDAKDGMLAFLMPIEQQLNAQGKTLSVVLKADYDSTANL